MAEMTAVGKGAPNLRMVILPEDVEFHYDDEWFDALATRFLPDVVEEITKPLD